MDLNLLLFASLTPMIFVQIYGIAVYGLVDAKEVSDIVIQNTVSVPTEISISSVITGLISVIEDVVPILVIILFLNMVF